MEWIARLLASALAALAGVQGSPPVAPPGPAFVRSEHFVLELVAAPGPVLEVPPGGAREVGLAVLKQRRVGDRVVLEWDLRFVAADEPDTRVRHVEVLAGGLRTFVWREFRPGVGRTLFVQELDAHGSLRAVEWGGPDGLREELRAPPGALFPLDLIERARAARLRDGALALFEPLEGRFGRIELTTRLEGTALSAVVRSASFSSATAPAGAAPLARTVELHRADGSLAGAYRFVGSHLEAFQWQAGSARARRVPAEVWRRRCERLDEAESAARE